MLSPDSASFDNSIAKLTKKYNPAERKIRPTTAGRGATVTANRLQGDKKCCNGINIIIRKSGCSQRTQQKAPKRTTNDACHQTDRISSQDKECYVTQDSVKASIPTPEPNYQKEKCEFVEKGLQTDEIRVNCKNGTTTKRQNCQPFPFVGESPSGNLKVSHGMVAYQNENLGILVADPKKVMLKHKEWHEDSSCSIVNDFNANNKIPNYYPDLKTAKPKSQQIKNVQSQPKRGLFATKLTHFEPSIKTILPTSSRKVFLGENGQGPDVDSDIIAMLKDPSLSYHKMLTSLTCCQDRSANNSYILSPPENKDSGEDINSENKQKETQAAITIQRYVRGFLTRRQVVKMKHAAQVIQDSLRAFRGNPKHDQFIPIPSLISGRSSTVALAPRLLQNLDIEKDALLLFGGSDPTQYIRLLTSPKITSQGMAIFMYIVDANLWHRVGTLPEPRTHFGIVRLHNDVYIIGGTDPRYKNSNERNVAVQSVWKVDLRTAEWWYDPEFPKDLENPKSHFGCVEHNGFVYVIGGCDEDSRALSECEIYDPEANTWTEIAHLLDGPRVNMGIAVFKNRIWVAGGLSKNSERPILRSVLCYDIFTNRWTAIQPLPLPRAFSSLVTAQGNIYIVGGAGPRSKSNKKQVSLPEVMVFDSASESWREIGVLEMARHGHATVGLGHNLVVLGGLNSERKGAISSVEIFNLTTCHSYKGRNLYKNLSGMGVIPLM